MLLYLTKYSRPDISNVVRELSKCMDGATWGAYLEMLRVIKFVIDTKTFGLKIMPKIEDSEDWNLKIFCDSDWAGDAETRISVTGFIVYLLDVPICWRSKGQRSVALSSTEAEYVAISEAAKEIKFIYYLLTDIHVKNKFANCCENRQCWSNFHVRKCIDRRADYTCGYEVSLCP